MSTSRRSFIKTGTMVAISAGISTGVAKTVLGNESCMPVGDVLSNLTKSDFESHINSNFRIRAAQRNVDLTLAAVTDLKRPANRMNKEGFSLIFDGPTAARLPQDTYVVEHDKLGKFSLLVVPVVSRKKKTGRYEVIINRIYT